MNDSRPHRLRDRRLRVHRRQADPPPGRDGWRVRALARSDTAAEKVSQAGAEPARGDLDDTAVAARGRRGRRRHFPRRGAPRRMGQAGGVRARERAGHAQRDRRQPRRGRAPLRPCRHRSRADGGAAARQHERGRAAAAGLEGPLLGHQGAGGAGRARRQRRLAGDGRRSGRGWSGARATRRSCRASSRPSARAGSRGSAAARTAPRPRMSTT